MEQTEIPLQDELLVKYLTGSANDEERKTAIDWIHQSKNNQVYFDQLRDIYEASKTVQPVSVYKTDLSWEKVKSMYYKRRFTSLKEEHHNKRLSFIRKILKYAAFILILINIGLLVSKIASQTESKRNYKVITTVEAPLGSKTILTLNDGTKVWLNAGSKLTYSNSFGKKDREVYLEGEAYFDVVKSKNMHFIVKTGYIDVKALGTKFNVKAYPEENTIQATLVEGLITIDGDRSQSASLEKEIYIRPNQSVTFIKRQKKYHKNSVNGKGPDVNPGKVTKSLILAPKIDPAFYTSWKDNRWKIQNESLFDLVIKLERKYNVKFLFYSESLKEYKFTGTLRDETLEQLLNVIKLSAPIEYSIRENTVFLRENKTFKESYDDMLMNRVK